MVWEPKTCCCGASIKTGTLILGWLGLVFNVLHVLTLLRFAALTREDFVKICAGISQENMEQPSMDPDMCAHSVIGVITSFGLTSALTVAICGMLLWGVNKFKPMMMLPFLIMQVFGLVVLGLITVAVLIVLAYFDLWLGAFIGLIIGGGLMFMNVYFFLIVRVCYKEVNQHSMAMKDGCSIAYMEHQDIPYKI